MNSSIQNKTGETAFWDKMARERIYAAFDDNEYLEVFDRTMDLDLNGKTIVDVGCASGVSAALLASRGAMVIGLDISPELIKQAQKLWPEYAEKITFMVGDAENLEIEDCSVDYCFFGGVLHHFPEKDRVYKESLRVLRPGGKFVALEPNRLDFFERIEWAVADLRCKLSPNEYPIDPKEMKQEVLATGFSKSSFWATRNDIPVLAQIPLVRRWFNRQKGFWFKRPVLRFFNAFRCPEHRGTFFVLEAIK
jgi:ubiquinone/menaquinone biosynthesis C-methylase UbiE